MFWGPWVDIWAIRTFEYVNLYFVYIICSDLVVSEYINF